MKDSKNVLRLVGSSKIIGKHASAEVREYTYEEFSPLATDVAQMLTLQKRLRSLLEEVESLTPGAAKE